MVWLRAFLIRLLAPVIALCACAATAGAAELVLFTRKSCPYCLLWEREIGPIYPKTDEARLAPLRRIDLDARGPGMPVLTPAVTITPTFVLVQDGREIGRFSGYSNDLSFWAMLETLLKKAHDRPSPASYSSPETRQ